MGHIVGQILFALLWCAGSATLVWVILRAAQTAYRRTLDRAAYVTTRAAAVFAGVVAVAAFAAVVSTWPKG